MALDPIVNGTTWRGVITVEPTSGQTNADVTTALTSATITALIVDPSGTTVVTASAVVTSAANRTVTITISTVNTALLTAGAVYAWKVLVVTTTPETFPLAVPGRPIVRATATP
jgi:hypothetical protein